MEASRFMPSSEADSRNPNVLPRDSSSRRNSASVNNENRRGGAIMDSIGSSSSSSSPQMARVSEPAGYPNAEVDVRNPNAEVDVRNPNAGMSYIPHISDDDCFKGFRQIEFGYETEFLLPESDGTNLNKSNEIELLDDDNDAAEKDGMVERLQKFKDELVCSVCLDLCYEPCTISCSHTFCKSCLINSIRACGSRCPTCRAEFYLGRQVPLVNTMIWNSIQLMFPDECADRKRDMEEEKALEKQQHEQHRDVSRRINDGDVSDQWHRLFTAFHEPAWAQEFFEADDMLLELDFRSSIGLGQRRSHGGFSRAARSGSSDRPLFQPPFIPATNATGIVSTPVSGRRSTAVTNASPELFYREQPLRPPLVCVPSITVSSWPARMNAGGFFNFAEEAENARRMAADWSRRQRARL